MKLLIFLFLLCLFVPLGAQLRTRYQALPAVQRPRVWRVQGRRWALCVVRL